MIYLDSAATALHRPPGVAAAVARAMETMGSASRGAHGGALAADRTVYAVRTKLARLFHAQPDRVCFAANATEALNTAIQGALPAGCRVLTTDWEHNSVLRPLRRLEDAGALTVDYVPADRTGRLADFAAHIRPDTGAIVCTHASNLTGELLDAAWIGRLARERGLLFILDAAQTAGCVPIDMEAMGIDILCFTGHKGLMGPQGTGGLCVRAGVEIRPLKEGGSGVRSYDRRQPAAYPTRLEAGTLNVHGLAGLSAALDWLLETGAAAVGERERALARRFYRGVADTSGVTVYGSPLGQARTGVVALNIGDIPSGETADALDTRYGIAVRPGAHCAPELHRALGTQRQGAVRFSFSWFNTEAEADAAASAVRELARTL